MDDPVVFFQRISEILTTLVRCNENTSLLAIPPSLENLPDVCGLRQSSRIFPPG